jgi:hypothetical protein
MEIRGTPPSDNNLWQQGPEPHESLQAQFVDNLNALIALPQGSPEYSHLQGIVEDQLSLLEKNATASTVSTYEEIATTLHDLKGNNATQASQQAHADALTTQIQNANLSPDQKEGIDKKIIANQHQIEANDLIALNPYLSVPQRQTLLADSAALLSQNAQLLAELNNPALAPAQVNALKAQLAAVNAHMVATKEEHQLITNNLVSLIQELQ